MSIKCIQSPVFRFWLSTLRDGKGKGLIVARIDRLKEGLVGDTRSLGHGISELRIHYGPGYEGQPMNQAFTTFDPAEHLDSGEAIAVFISDALETGDAAYIAHAMGVVARARGMSQLANDTGLSREQLYRSFSEHGNPTLKTVLAVLDALDIDLNAHARNARP